MTETPEAAREKRQAFLDQAMIAALPVCGIGAGGYDLVAGVCYSYAVALWNRREHERRSTAAIERKAGDSPRKPLDEPLGLTGTP